MKTLKQLVEATTAKLHPDALHVSPVKSGGQTKYKVHAVGKNLAHGIKVGEHLTDTHLDDAAEMGAKIKQIKAKHEAQQAGMKAAKADAVDEMKLRIEQALAKHTDVEALSEKWTNMVEGSEPLTTPASGSASTAKHFAKMKNRPTSQDQDTDVIRDYDADVPSDVKKAQSGSSISLSTRHHKKLKQFRVYKEELVTEAISVRQALSKAAEFEFDAANSEDPHTSAALKGKAKALRRAARLAAGMAKTVNLDITKQ